MTEIFGLKTLVCTVDLSPSLLSIQCARSEYIVYRSLIPRQSKSDFSAPPARMCKFCSGHQIAAVFFYLLHLADVVCCWASTILVNTAHTYRSLLAGEGEQFWQPILVRLDQFLIEPKFAWQCYLCSHTSSHKLDFQPWFNYPHEQVWLQLR